MRTARLLTCPGLLSQGNRLYLPLSRPALQSLNLPLPANPREAWLRIVQSPALLPYPAECRCRWCSRTSGGGWSSQDFPEQFGRLCRTSVEPSAPIDSPPAAHWTVGRDHFTYPAHVPYSIVPGSPEAFAPQALTPIPGSRLQAFLLGSRFPVGLARPLSSLTLMERTTHTFPRSTRALNRHHCL